MPIAGGIIRRHWSRSFGGFETARTRALESLTEERNAHIADRVRGENDQ